MSKVFNFGDALLSLCPGVEWTIYGNNYDTLVFHTTDTAKPSLSELTAEVQRLQEDYDSKLYQRLRMPEYPPIEDYLDGIVKDDQQQIAAYIAACQAVKAKYPKPE